MNSQNSVAEERELLCAVALNAMLPLANERTLQAAYYILRGRKANQTLQDVHLYNLYPYYRMFPGFSKEDWDKIVATLFQNDYLQPCEGEGPSPKPTFLVTANGRQFAEHAYEKYGFAVWFAPFTRFDLAARIESFWQRLHLLVQTVSQLLGKDLGFVLSRDGQVRPAVGKRTSRASEVAGSMGSGAVRGAFPPVGAVAAASAGIVGRSAIWRLASGEDARTAGEAKAIVQSVSHAAVSVRAGCLHFATERGEAGISPAFTARRPGKQARSTAERQRGPHVCFGPARNTQSRDCCAKTSEREHRRGSFGGDRLALPGVGRCGLLVFGNARGDYGRQRAAANEQTQTHQGSCRPDCQLLANPAGFGPQAGGVE